MSEIKFLNLPRIVLPSSYYSTDDIYYSSKIPGFISYKIISESVLRQLNSIFRPIINDIEGMFIQTIGPSFCNYIHKDPRSYAINYILDTGGDNVNTAFFENGYNSTCVPKEAWHYFRADRLHAVQNITTTRIAITISIKHELSIDTVNWLESISI